MVVIKAESGRLAAREHSARHQTAPQIILQYLFRRGVFRWLHERGKKD